MALETRQLDTYRKLLHTRRDALAAELRQATAELIQGNAVYTDTIDQASADMDKSLALQMKNRDRGILLQIDEALRRIDAGNFGECESCSESISEARIQAFPLTTLCIDCKAELESENHRYPGRA